MKAQLSVPLLAAVLLLAPAALPAQVAPPRDAVPGTPAPQAAGTASVSGAVTMGGSGQPARKTRVSLSGTEIRGSRAATTDDQGRFSFTGLPAGRYTLSASRPGHVTVTYGQRRPGRPGTQIQLSDGQRFRADLQIPRGSVITGTVLDENGEPSPQVSVRAMRVTVQNGERTMTGSNGSSTDDRGIYRLFGLTPGDYIVCATPRNNAVNELDRSRAELQALQQTLETVSRTNEADARGIRDRIASLQSAVAGATDENPPPGYAPICYPGAISTTNAAPITVGTAEERTAIDFQLQLAPMARVEGTVVNATGAQVRDIQIRLNDLGQLNDSLGSSSTRADADGRFRLPNVSPGQYRLTARATTQGPRGGVPETAVPGRPAPSAPAVTFWASADIVVDGRNVSNVMLSLQPGASLSGQVRFEGTTAPPTDLTRLRVTMSPVDSASSGPAAGGRVDASGRFTIPSVTPGRYRLMAGGANGWFVDTATIGGQDALDMPVEVKGSQSLAGAVITLTDRQAEITGTVVDNANRPAVDYTLVAFSADQRFWSRNSRRIRTTRPATDGKFTFGNMPAGEYLIAPVVDLEPGAAYDPAVLQQLEASAVRVTLQGGEKKVQDLQVR